jgi:2-methylcitrate dehydratase PrpD
MTETSKTSLMITQFVANARYDHIPAMVIHEAKRSLLNFFETAISDSYDKPIDVALRSLMTFSDCRQGTVIGRPERVDALSAAFLNAASANISDFKVPSGRSKGDMVF